MSRIGSGDVKAAFLLVELFLSLPLPVQIGLGATGAAGAGLYFHALSEDQKKRPAIVDPMIKTAIEECANSGIDDWEGGAVYKQKLRPVLMTAWTKTLTAAKDNKIHICLDQRLNGISGKYNYWDISGRHKGDKSVVAIFRREANGDRILTIKTLPELTNGGEADLEFSAEKVLKMVNAQIDIEKSASSPIARPPVQFLIKHEGLRYDSDGESHSEEGHNWAKDEDLATLNTKYSYVLVNPLRQKQAPILQPAS